MLKSNSVPLICRSTQTARCHRSGLFFRCTGHGAILAAVSCSDFCDISYNPVRFFEADSPVEPLASEIEWILSFTFLLQSFLSSTGFRSNFSTE